MYTKLEKKLKKKYLNAQPYPHLIIDNFIADDFFLKSLIQKIPVFEPSISKLNDYKNRQTLLDVNLYSKEILKVLNYFYDEEFLSFCDELCDKKLIRGLENNLHQGNILRHRCRNFRLELTAF